MSDTRPSTIIKYNDYTLNIKRRIQYQLNKILFHLFMFVSDLPCQSHLTTWILKLENAQLPAFWIGIGIGRKPTPPYSTHTFFLPNPIQTRKLEIGNPDCYLLF